MPETCDARDQDCDGAVDEGLSPGWLDADGDGYGDALIPPVCPAGLGMVPVAGDCADQDAAVNPGQPDPLDAAGVDTNCDGLDGEVGRLVFVSPDGDDAAAGTPDAPLLTLPAAIARGTQVVDLQGIIVGSGRYAGDVRLAPGVHLYGGYDRAAG